MKSTTGFLFSALLLASPAFAAISELTGVVQLDVGGRSGCAVTSAGAAKCWGDNTHGVLGDGSVVPRPWAADVQGMSSGVAAVTVSRAWDAQYPDVVHACALTTSGEVKCWGDNSRGQLGTGNASGFTTSPGAAVAGFASAPIAISAGWAHTCALLTDGSVACWGQNQDGQLGDGTQVNRSAPVAVAGLGGVVQVAAGSTHTCALTSAGAVKCWGANASGELGVSTGGVGQPTPVDVAGLSSGVAGIAAGGTIEQRCTLSGSTVTCGKSMVMLNPKGGHSCAIATGGAAKCWGSGHAGQLGDGTSGGNQPLPVNVVGLGSGVVQISAGGVGRVTGPYTLNGAPGNETTGHTCALTTAGTVKCWGHNYCGVLGNGGTGACGGHVFSAVPVDVVGLADVQSVAAGGEFACALTNGRVRCWGMGYGSTPLPVFAGTVPQGTVITGDTSIRRLANISTRAKALTGDEVVIGGFIIGGSASKTVAIVATGPSLVRDGIANPLGNPSLTLRRSSDQAVVATNDDWMSAANAAQIHDSGFAPSMASEAAILATLAPGAYTAVVSGSDGSTGVALVGIFEVDNPETPLANISTRARVLLENDVMIGGFIIQGAAEKTVAVRAVGPSLAAFGIASPLQNPTLLLVRATDGAIMAANDDWQSDASATQLAAAGFAPSNALEAGVLVTLQPGAYTVIVRGANGTTGVGLVEVFAVP